MRVALVGLGPIGLEAVRALSGAVEIVGGADPALAGQVVAGVGTVVADAGALYDRAEVCVLCTGSTLPSIAASLEAAIDAGVHVVSSCEELSYPWLRHRALATRLDERARARGVVVLGVGVNPGLVMDRLAWTALSACVSVDGWAHSIVDAGTAAAAAQKVGEG